MKSKLMAGLLLLYLLPPLSAAPPDYTLSGGAEGNIAAFSSFGAGVSLSLGLFIFPRLSAGFHFVTSAAFDSASLSGTENYLFLRWTPFLRLPEFGLRLQAGGSFFVHQDRSAIFPSAALGLDFRFPLSASWYLEPYIRGGYPILAGAGIVAGVRFDRSGGGGAAPDPSPGAEAGEDTGGTDLSAEEAPVSEGVVIRVAVFPVGNEGLSEVNEPFGQAVYEGIEGLEGVEAMRITAFPLEFFPDEPPRPAETANRRYAATSAFYAPRGIGDRYHLQVWLWDVETPALVYTDELVCDDLEDAEEFITLMLEWIFSNVPAEEEAAVEAAEAAELPL
jgi:hypothetical protein